jgi:rod shape-determining protein MreD
MLLNPTRYWWLVPASITLAFLWQFWPLPSVVRQVAPDAIVSVVLYWAMQRPRRINTSGALILGVLRDGAEGLPLGAHALAMVLSVYLAELFGERVRKWALWQQSIIIGLLYTFYLLIGNWALLLTSHGTTPPLFLVPALTTGLCWPACYFVLNLLEHGGRLRKR